VAEALKAENPSLQVGMVGAKVAVEPERSLRASAAIGFVAREEFDFTIAEMAEGRPLASVAGVSYKGPDGQAVHNPDRETLEDMDRLPFVSPVYHRDLRPEDYYIGYLLHPYAAPVRRAGLPVVGLGVPWLGVRLRGDPAEIFGQVASLLVMITGIVITAHCAAQVAGRTATGQTSKQETPR
jgi:hypothetical protein